MNSMQVRANGTVLRLHQIDLCQAMGAAVVKKDESEGGLGLEDLFAVLRGPKATVAPFYDLLCVEAYLPRQTMAMSIAGENKPGWIEGQHWDAMARAAGVVPRLVRGVLTRLIAELPDAMTTVLGDARILPPEQAFLRGKVLPVIEERSGFVAAALKM